MAAGKIDPATGDPRKDGLDREPQDCRVVPKQPWIDG